ncbi:hypothetical protein psal_cds_771 [Pandoravirus salinus]|uniref:F-box domain containing protein n=1 Tax=Pandoravirus salinus TaxID=1349410 RepID=S4W3D2_9VIRU|nr:hypothetical protein psal_cds_771 [Pandoravirus salinus]AGO84770.1 hypothetical protein psal_cds_771 [Pandoravirus salinus]
MDTLPPEIGCAILASLEPTWLMSASMASRRLAAWASLVHHNTPPRVPNDYLDVAARCGNWNVMRWLHDDLRHPWTARVLVTAALNDQRAIFLRLLADGTCPVDERVAAAALVGGGPALLEEALARGCPRSPLLTTVAILLDKRRVAEPLLRRGYCDWLTNLCAVAIERTMIGEMTLNVFDHERVTKWLASPWRHAPYEYWRAIRKIDLWAHYPNVLAWHVARGSILLLPRTSPLVPNGAVPNNPYVHWMLNQDDPSSSWHDEDGPWVRYFTLSASLTERRRTIQQPRPKPKQSNRSRQRPRHSTRLRPRPHCC